MSAPIHLIVESEALFLRQLLASPDGVSAMISAPPPYDRTPYPDGGAWRGAIPLSLVRRGIIVRVDAKDGSITAIVSARPTRSHTAVTRWRLIDREAAAARLAELSGRCRKPVATLFD